MIQVRSFEPGELPREIAWQIRSYLRVQWPQLSAELGNELWDESTDPAVMRFIVTDGELLISHAAINRRQIVHEGARFIVYGLSSVFTFPDRRGRGHARAVVDAATKHIRSSDADIALLFCGDALRSFYEVSGWSELRAKILYGDPASPMTKADNIVMMLTVSPHGETARRLFETKPVYVGNMTW